MTHITGFNAILDPILGPLLKLEPFWAILVLSFVVSGLITVVYKKFTNQQLLKQLKDDMKQHQTRMKENKNNPEKVTEFQKKALETNLELMKHSFKPTLITLLPIILIFGWVSPHYAFQPLLPEIPFTITLTTQQGIEGTLQIKASEQVQVLEKQPITNNQAIFQVTAPQGDHILQFFLNNQTYEKIIHVSTAQESLEEVKNINDQQLKTITINYQKLITMDLFGWKLGWIGSYIIWSIAFSTLFRKLFKVH